MAHGGEKSRLGAVGRLRLLARFLELGLRASPLGDVAPQALNLVHGRATRGRHRVLLPLEPARAARSLDLLNIALLAQGASGSQRGGPLARQHAGREAVSEHRTASQPEHLAERLVDERQAAFAVATDDHIGLVVEQIAIARLVLTDFPLQVLELLETALEALTDVQEPVELGGKVTRRRAAGTEDHRQRSWRFQRLEPGPNATRQGSELRHA